MVRFYCKSFDYTYQDLYDSEYIKSQSEILGLGSK